MYLCRPAVCSSTGSQALPVSQNHEDQTCLECPTGRWCAPHCSCPDIGHRDSRYRQLTSIWKRCLSSQRVLRLGLLNFNWLPHLPSVSKRARLVWRIRIMSRRGPQVTCNVELRHRRSVCEGLFVWLFFSLDRPAHLSVVGIIELKGINDQLEFIVLPPGLKVGSWIWELRVNQAPKENQEYITTLSRQDLKRLEDPSTKF